MNFDAIIAALPELSISQLRQIRAIVDLRLKTERDPESSFELMVLECITNALRPHIHVSMRICMNSAAYPSFRDKIPDLEKVFERDGLSRLKLMWLLSFAIREMIRWGQKRGMFIDHTFIMTNVHRLPAHINRSFPGYAECGFLGTIRKHGNGTEKRK